MSASAFAAREGLNAGTLSWWSSQLRAEVRPRPAFVDVTSVVAASAGAAIEVVVGDSVRIRVNAGFDPELLRAVVAALEER